MTLPGSSSPPESLFKPHPRWRPGRPQLSPDSRGLRQPWTALGSRGIHSPPVPAGIRAGCHRLREAAAAGPAPESERERGCECAQRPAVALCVSCVCGVARACVSVNVRVRADTATPASRRAGLPPAEGPGTGRGASGAGDHCVCLSVRPFSRLPSQAFPLADPPAPPPAASTATSALPDTRHRAGAALGSGAAAAVAPCEAAAPRTAEPRAPAERAPRPRPASAPRTRLCLGPPHHRLRQLIQQLEAKLPRVQRPLEDNPILDPPPPGAPLSACALIWDLCVTAGEPCGGAAAFPFCRPDSRVLAPR